MNEYISKQSVLDYLNGYLHSIGEYNLLLDIGQRRALTNTIQDISAVKAADVQPIKHGRWIWVKDYRDCEGDIYSQYKCSCCDFCVGGVYSVKDLTHFCGNCGARMDGDTNG